MQVKKRKDYAVVFTMILVSWLQAEVKVLCTHVFLCELENERNQQDDASKRSRREALSETR